jgi:hypothetical protein
MKNQYIQLATNLLSGSAIYDNLNSSWNICSMILHCLQDLGTFVVVVAACAGSDVRVRVVIFFLKVEVL